MVGLSDASLILLNAGIDLLDKIKIIHCNTTSLIVFVQLSSARIHELTFYKGEMSSTNAAEDDFL